MDRWMAGWLDGQMEGWMGRWVDKQMSKWMGACIHAWMNNWIIIDIAILQECAQGSWEPHSGFVCRCVCCVAQLQVWLTNFLMWWGKAYGKGGWVRDISFQVCIIMVIYFFICNRACIKYSVHIIIFNPHSNFMKQVSYYPQFAGI